MIDDETRQELNYIGEQIKAHGKVDPELVLSITDKGEISFAGLGRIALNLKLHQVELLLKNVDRIREFAMNNIDRLEKWESNGRGGFRKKNE